MDLCLSPGIVIFIYVGLGILLDLFTGTATFSYAVLGIRMCISPGTRDGARDPSGEANHPWDNNKLRPGGSQPPAGSAHKQDCTLGGVLPGSLVPPPGGHYLKITINRHFGSSYFLTRKRPHMGQKPSPEKSVPLSLSQRFVQPTRSFSEICTESGGWETAIYE